jgi:hypothetical protein
VPVINCKTDHALLLLAIPDARGVLHFPSTADAPLPGLHLEVKPLLPIQAQLTAAATAAVGRDVALDLHLWDELADEMTLPNGTKTTMYVASLKGEAADADRWPVMPAILRAMDKNRGRLPYLRAWQVLQGGLKLNTKAVEASELLKHFPEDAEP